MANPKGNPDIKKNTEKTRFKKGNKVAARPPGDERPAPWSIRNQLRYIAAQEIDPLQLDKEIARLMRDPATKRATFARVVAIRMVEKVIKKMEAQLVDKMIEHIEGKLPDTVNLNPPRRAPTKFKTLEEAAAAYAEYIRP